MAVVINFGVIVINNLASNAGLFLGENVQQGWNSPTKTNQALNMFGVATCSLNNINVNSDPDLADTPNLYTNNNIPAAPVIVKGC